MMPKVMMTDSGVYRPHLTSQIVAQDIPLLYMGQGHSAKHGAEALVSRGPRRWPEFERKYNEELKVSAAFTSLKYCSTRRSTRAITTQWWCVR